MRPRPARSVAEWIETTPEALLYLSVITIGEIRKGIDLLEESEPKRAALQSWIDGDGGACQGHH
jgi:predicted nucleic acid-binding protein